MNVNTFKNSILFFFLFIFFIAQNLYSSEIFTIQAGVFSIKNNAISLVESIKKHGIKCANEETGETYRVFCGEFNQKSDAYVLKEKLASLGYQKVFVVSMTSQDTISGDTSEEQSLLHKVSLPSQETTDENSTGSRREEFSSETPVLLDRVVAVVNKEVITWSELYKVMEFESTEQIKNLSEEEQAKIFKENEPLFLETLIDMRLQLQEARSLGIGITREEVDETIENIKKKYTMSDEDFKASIKKEGFTLEEYKKRLAEQILINKVVQFEIKNKIVISDAEVKKYMDANKETFSGGEKYRLRQIFFKGPEGGMDKKAIEEKALLVLQKLKAGEDFSNLARIYSEDPSGKLGGDLGLIDKGLLASEFTNVLSGMKVGDYSMPFWTQRGLHIIKLDEKISAQNIDQVKEDVRRQLAEAKFSENYKSWIKGLREKAFIEIRL
jgi:peptidyl-prolyl cis-trans isomerase SurA